MLQELSLPSNQDWVLVVGAKSIRVDFATLQGELTLLTGEANNWVGGSVSS